MPLSSYNIDTIIPLTSPNEFALYDLGGYLLIFNIEKQHIEQKISVPILDIQKTLRFDICFPYLVIVESYGVNGFIINLNTQKIQIISREDYDADVSRYSIAFIKRENKILLIHQTQWNRLDITDVATGECLTPRQIIAEQIGKKVIEFKGKNCIVPNYKEENYIDYFHSGLLVSPDQTHFLSNGWVWQPADIIYCFNIEKFFTEFETAHTIVDYWGGYNWDHPCTFIDNHRFIMAVDKTHESELDPDDEDDKNYQYKQFFIFDIHHLSEKSHNNYFYLEKTAAFDTSIFPLNSDFEVSGELHFDSVKNVLIGMSEKGTTLFSTTGEIYSFVDYIKPFSDRKFNNERFINSEDNCVYFNYCNSLRMFYGLNKNKIMVYYLDEIFSGGK